MSGELARLTSKVRVLVYVLPDESFTAQLPKDEGWPYEAYCLTGRGRTQSEALDDLDNQLEAL